MQSHRAAILELANLIFAKKPGKSEPAGLELNIDPLLSLIWYRENNNLLQNAYLRITPSADNLISTSASPFSSSITNHAPEGVSTYSASSISQEGYETLS